MGEPDYSALIEQLRAGDMHTRLWARQKLSEAGESAIPKLEQAASSKDPYLRWQAAKALSQMGIPAVIPVLIDMMRESADAGVRWMAADGLIGMREAGLVPLLKSLTAHSDSVLLREGAHHVLRFLHDSGIESKAIEITLDALGDVEPAVEVPWAAEETLKNLNDMG
jgi:HEAT repeat protein